MDYASLFHIRAYPLAYRVAFEGIGSTKSVYINRTYRRNIDYVSRVNAGCKSNYWNLFPYNGGGAYRDTIGIFTRSKKKKRKEGRKWRMKRVRFVGHRDFALLLESHRIRFRATERKEKRLIENCDGEKL